MEDSFLTEDFTSEVFISEKMLESQSGTQTLHQESSSMKVPQDENDIGKLKDDSMNMDTNPRVRASEWFSQIRGSIIDKAKTRMSYWKDKKVSPKAEPGIPESTTSSISSNEGEWQTLFIPDSSSAPDSKLIISETFTKESTQSTSSSSTSIASQTTSCHPNTPNLEDRKDSPTTLVGKTAGFSEQINKFMKTLSIKFKKESREITNSTLITENTRIPEPSTANEHENESNEMEIHTEITDCSNEKKIQDETKNEDDKKAFQKDDVENPKKNVSQSKKVSAKDWKTLLDDDDCEQKSLDMVQKWIDSIPSPPYEKLSGSEENFDYGSESDVAFRHQTEDQMSSITYTSKASQLHEDLVLINPDPLEGVQTHLDSIKIPDASESTEQLDLHPALDEANSISNLNHCQKNMLDYIFNSRAVDPAELLLDLGFGGSPPSTLSRIPLRFFTTKSSAKGISVEGFLRWHEELENRRRF